METGTQLQLRRLKSGTALRRLRRQFLPVAQATPPHTRAHWSRLAGRALQPPATPCQEERFNVSGGWGETVVSEAPGYQSDGVCPSPGDCIGTASVTTSTGGVTSSSCNSCYPQGGCLSTCTYAANWIQAGTCPGSSSGTLGGYPPASATYETSHVLAICRSPSCSGTYTQSAYGLTVHSASSCWTGCSTQFTGQFNPASTLDTTSNFWLADYTGSGQTSWSSSIVQDAQWLIYSFTSSVTLTGMKLTPGQANYGISTVTVQYSSSASGPWTDTSAGAITIPSASNTNTEGTYTWTAASGQYWRFYNMVAQDSSRRCKIMRVKFAAC